jgi:ribonuclease HI
MIGKAYRTVSNKVLCIITGLIPINIKIEEAAKLHDLTKGEGTWYDRAMDVKNWVHPSKPITIIEGQEKNTHSLQVYTDGSKNEGGVGTGIAVFAGTILITIQSHLFNGSCTNNQAEQLAILKALECIQNLQDGGKTIIVYTDSKITLQLLTNHKRHTYLIDKIKIKIMAMETNEWQIKFSWIKARAGTEGNELADRLAKKASISSNIKVCYNKIPKSTIARELNGLRIKQWQNEWNTTTKGAITKYFYPNLEHRMTLKISPTPNFTSIVTGHGNINSYLHKFNIIENPGCPCNKDQTVDHIIYSCGLQEQERNSLKAAIQSSEKWPVNKRSLATKYYKLFKLFTDSIVINKEQGHV